MNIIFTGSGEFGVPTLLALLRGGIAERQTGAGHSAGAAKHTAVQVISQPDRPAGRGRALTPTPISAIALEAGLPLLRTQNINAEVLPPADLMIVIAFGQKIADSIVHHPRLGSINLHASRLPKYRGAAPINWAIIRGESITGNSIIRLAQKMDAGAILAQSDVIIGPTETAGELHDRLADEGVALMCRTIDALANGTAMETPQDESLATLAPKLSRGSARLDFASPAVELARQIRGLYPWPGCRVKLCDAAGGELGRMRLASAVAGLADEGSRWEPGEIMLDGHVQTGAGALDIISLQPEGRNLMPLGDYRRGRPWPPGAKLHAIDA